MAEADGGEGLMHGNGKNLDVADNEGEQQGADKIRGENDAPQAEDAEKR